MKRLITLTLILSTLYGVSQQRCEVEQKKNIYAFNLFTKSTKPNVNCFRIPAIVTAKNGDIIVAVDERVPSCSDLRWNNNINIVIRRSMDNGDTWTNPETLIDYPEGRSGSDPSFILDKITGTIFLFYNYMDLINHSNVYFQMYIKSDDNGKTWSPPVDITMNISRPEWYKDFKFITSGEGTQTNSGTLLHTLVNIENGVFVFKSDDHGNNWSLINTPIKPADESKIIELNDGTWMINSRVNGLGSRYVHLSKDQGKSWLSYNDTILLDPGCNASIIRYQSDNSDHPLLIFSNVSSRDKRMNLVVRSSNNEGKTWSGGIIICNGSAAYSSLTILKNGDIGLIFEKDNYSEIMFARVPIRNLTNKSDYPL